MSKAVLISIQPKWCKLIASGKKTVEVRKTRPKLEMPFKCYIYETKGKLQRYSSVAWENEGKGKVIGEFVCSNIAKGTSQLGSCLTMQEISEYANNKEVYGWCISDLVIYDVPKELSEFKQCHKCEYYANCYEHEYSCDGAYNLTRPPQSWCYVEELNE